MTRHEVLRILAGCLQDQTQAEIIREWSEKPERTEGEPLDNASAALLFAAAMGDSESWRSLTAMHPALSDLDASDMPVVLDRLFT